MVCMRARRASGSREHRRHVAHRAHGAAHRPGDLRAPLARRGSSPGPPRSASRRPRRAGPSPAASRSGGRACRARAAPRGGRRASGRGRSRARRCGGAARARAPRWRPGRAAASARRARAAGAEHQVGGAGRDRVGDARQLARVERAVAVHEAHDSSSRGAQAGEAGGAEAGPRLAHHARAERAATSPEPSVEPLSTTIGRSRPASARAPRAAPRARRGPAARRRACAGLPAIAGHAGGLPSRRHDPRHRRRRLHRLPRRRRAARARRAGADRRRAAARRAPRAAGLPRPAAERVEGDLRDAAVAARAAGRRPPSATRPRWSASGPTSRDIDDYVGHNDLAHRAAPARAGRARLRGRFVLASSMVVYGEAATPARSTAPCGRGPRRRALDAGEFEPPCPVCGRPLEPRTVPEDAPLDPRNVYAATKVAQEHLCAAFSRETGVPVTALRYHNVYGPRMPRDTPYAGVAASSAPRSPRASAPRGLRGRRQRRDFVHVRDVARANVLALTGRAGRRARSTWPAGRRARCSTWRGRSPARSTARRAAGHRASGAAAMCATCSPRPSWPRSAGLPRRARTSRRGCGSSPRPRCAHDERRCRRARRVDGVRPRAAAARARRDRPRHRELGGRGRRRAVAAVQLAKLGGGADFFTALGSDERARRSAERLEAHGVRVHAAPRDVPQRRGSRTSTATASGRSP